MNPINNSVGRLFNILRQFQKNASGKNETLASIIGKVFSIDHNNPSQTLQIQLELIHLIKVSKEEVLKLPSTSHNLHLRALQKIETAFSVHHLHSNWVSFSEYLDPATMTSLEHTADNLSYSGEQIISEDELEELKNQVDELLEAVLKMDVNSKLKAFLLEQINKISQAILYYRINGARGLRNALEQMMGASAIFTKESPNEQMPEDIKPKFTSMFWLLVKLVAFANDIKGLTGVDLLKLPGIL